MALSELTKKRTNAGFRSWLLHATNAEAFVGTPSIGELEAGIVALGPGEKQRALEAWLNALIDGFGERVLPFDIASARAWGRANALARHRGVSVPIVDAQLAAIALANDLTVVTRNVRHFRNDVFEGLKILNPWT